MDGYLTGGEGLPDEDVSSICRTEAELTHAYGDQTLAFFGLAPGNEHFLAPGGRGLVNYRLMNRVAVVSGDPLCAPEAIEQVTRSFLDFCALRRWSVAFYQARPTYLATYRSFKLRVFKIGEEAMLSPQTFTLQGAALANVRTSCRRAERDGIHIQWYEGVPPAEILQKFASVSRAWLEHKGGNQAEETGFSTGRLNEIMMSAQRADRLADLAGLSSAEPLRFMTGVAMTSFGHVCAFVTFTPVYGTTTGNEDTDQNRGWALDLMRRTPDAPPGVMELLLVRAVEHFRMRGACKVSLGLASLADTSQEVASIERQLASFVARRLGLFTHNQTLFKFKQKFRPRWESRYLVTSTTFTLPKIALAVLRLRNYPARGLTGLLTRRING